MAQTPTTMANVAYEVWTDKTIQEQYFADDGPLSRIESVPATMIGKQAQVPVWGDLNSGGFTTTSTAGGSVNTASNQGTAQALYTLTQHLFPISVEVGALNQMSGNSVQSAIGALDLEIKGGINTMRNQATRQLVTNGDGKVAACGTSGGASTTLPLVASPSATAYGYDAIRRNWLRPGAVVDIGTTADTDALATAATVTAVSPVASAPTITTTASVDATAGTHFVYIANPNSATAANPESNGLRNLINSTGAVGGLNPATAGQEYWAAYRDTTTTVLSLDLMLNLNREVRQTVGDGITDVWCSLKQQQNWYALLQNQVRFASDSGLSAGNAASATWNGMKVTAYNSILDSDIYFLTLSDFVRVTGAIKSPTWYSSLAGNNKGMVWSGAGTTSFADQLFYAFQVGLRRRNSHAAATALTA